MDILRKIESFCGKIAANDVEIYNEFSLQHELGVYLRDELPNLKVQFERNVSYFELKRTDFTKREIDIVVLGENVRSALELKYPRNGQHPEQMFSFCRDIAFLEELNASGFRECIFLAVVDDPLFYRGSTDGIYGYFRGGRTLTGHVQKPTGKKDSSVSIGGRYNISWQPLSEVSKYTIVRVGT